MPSALTDASSDLSARLDDVDATRAFVLLLGVVFHASLSFHPMFIGWAVQDVATSPWVASFVTVSHAFRMETFFLLAGVLGRRAFHRKGVVAFVRSRLLRLGVPFVAGWLVLRPLLVSGWMMGAASLRGDVEVGVALRGGFASLLGSGSGVFTGTHLWFLYYLLGATGVWLAVRGFGAALGERRDRWLRRLDAGTHWVVNSPWAPAVAALPTACALVRMKSWGMDTPDRTLWPHLPVLAVYTSYFALGWLLGRRSDAMEAFANPTWARGLWAASGIAVVLVLGHVERDPGHPQFALARVGHALGYAAAMFALASLTVGFFRKVCTQRRGWVRYLADASYWVYLVHLPVVVWLQVAVAELPGGWILKLGLVSAAAVAISVLSYDLFVRSTRLGELLNGRRQGSELVSWALRWRR